MYVKFSRFVPNLDIENAKCCFGCIFASTYAPKVLSLVFSSLLSALGVVLLLAPPQMSVSFIPDLSAPQSPCHSRRGCHPYLPFYLFAIVRTHIQLGIAKKFSFLRAFLPICAFACTLLLLAEWHDNNIANSIRNDSILVLGFPPTSYVYICTRSSHPHATFIPTFVGQMRIEKGHKGGSLPFFGEGPPTIPLLART